MSISKFNSLVLTFLSNSSSCSYVDQIQFLFKCNSFLLTAKWLVRIQEQLVPANSILLSVKQQVRIQEQLVPANSILLSVKQQVRIQEQLVPTLLISAERLVQIQEQLVLYILFLVSQVTSSNTRTACAFYFVFLQPSN